MFYFILFIYFYCIFLFMLFLYLFLYLFYIYFIYFVLFWLHYVRLSWFLEAFGRTWNRSIFSLILSAASATFNSLPPRIFTLMRRSIWECTPTPVMSATPHEKTAFVLRPDVDWNASENHTYAAPKRIHRNLKAIGYAQQLTPESYSQKKPTMSFITQMHVTDRAKMTSRTRTENTFYKSGFDAHRVDLVLCLAITTLCRIFENILLINWMLCMNICAKSDEQLHCSDQLFFLYSSPTLSPISDSDSDSRTYSVTQWLCT